MNANSLSKDMILQQTSCNDIYTKFLGINSFPKRNFSSPFTEDKTPSFTLYPKGTFKCHSSGKQGDVWQFVADLKELNVKTQFQDVLKTIATEMQLITDKSKIFSNVNKKDNNIEIEPAQLVAIKKVQVVKREFTELDLQFWSKLGVDKSILDKYKVHSIANYCWVGKKPIYTKKEAVAFAFELYENFKLYIPQQKEIGIEKKVLPPFPGNPIFGLQQLTTTIDNLVICEGEKDTIVANSRGFNAVTFGSGSIHLKQDAITQLQSRCINLFVCFDADNTGITGMQNLIKLNPKIIPLQLPTNENIKGYDLTDYFQQHTANDFQKIMDLAVKNKSVVDITKNTTNGLAKKETTNKFEITESYLEKNYDFRNNIVLKYIEIRKKEENDWELFNENNIYLELQKKNINISMPNLLAIIRSDFVKKFNPIKEYFENLTEWDKEIDYITEYSRYIILGDDEDVQQFEYHFKKWCVRAVKCALNESYFNKQCFVLSGEKQDIGKSTWLRYLNPKELQDYIKDNISDNTKDAKIELGKNFLINLDELASLTSKREANKLKELISIEKINERLPHDRTNSIFPRIANFIGSTNRATFLQDETGSIRWLCFVVQDVDFSYRKKVNIDNLWKQAFFLANDKNFNSEMTKEDKIKNEIRNDKFQENSSEIDLMQKFFEKPKDNIDVEYLTSTDILTYLSSYAPNVRLSIISIGKALTKLGYKREKYGKPFYCYAVKKSYTNNI